jgi:hypothetical protein
MAIGAHSQPVSTWFKYKFIFCLIDSNIEVRTNQHSEVSSRQVLNEKTVPFVVALQFDTNLHYKRLPTRGSTDSIQLLIKQGKCTCLLTLKNIVEYDYFLDLHKVDWCKYTDKNIVVKLKSPLQDAHDGHSYVGVYWPSILYYYEYNYKYTVYSPYGNPHPIVGAYKESLRRERHFDCDITPELLKELRLINKLSPVTDTLFYQVVKLPN